MDGSTLLGLEAAAVDLDAGAGRHVDPGVAASRLAHLAGAGIAGGLAVVLARRDDAEALLVVGGRSGADHRRGDGGGDGTGENEGGLHGRGLLERLRWIRSAGDAMHLPSPQASDPAQPAKMPCSHSLDNDTASGNAAVHNG